MQQYTNITPGLYGAHPFKMQYMPRYTNISPVDIALGLSKCETYAMVYQYYIWRIYYLAHQNVT